MTRALLNAILRERSNFEPGSEPTFDRSPSKGLWYNKQKSGYVRLMHLSLSAQRQCFATTIYLPIDNNAKRASLLVVLNNENDRLVKNSAKLFIGQQHTAVQQTIKWYCQIDATTPKVGNDKFTHQPGSRCGISCAQRCLETFVVLDSNQRGNSATEAKGSGEALPIPSPKNSSSSE